MDMNSKKIFSRLLILAAVLFLADFVCAQEFPAGNPAPYFKVLSGDNEELTLDDIKGKAAVIFYETKDTVEKNRQLKDELNKFYDAQTEKVKKSILRIPVINCKGVFFTDIWKANLRQSSRKEGFTIYGDWDGKMFLAYGIKDNDSNLIIIGKDGIVKYSFSGRVGEKEFSRIKDLLTAEANPPEFRISLL
jgi:hypothetical protein